MNDLTLRAAASTHPGQIREHNEDALLADGTIFAVADGMGGHEAGDVASAAVISALQVVRGGNLAPGGEATTPEAVVAALAVAQQQVAAISHGRVRAAGSTVAGVAAVDVADAAHWLVFNVGDSRVYRWWEGRLRQLSVDHSLVQEWVDEGTLTRQEARRSSQRNVITRALGAADHEVDYYLTPALDGDRILICSDGLNSELEDHEIAALLAGGRTAESAAQSLVTAALNHGGRDNVTVVVVDVLAGGLDPQQLRVRGGAAPGADVVTCTDEADEDTAPAGRGGTHE